MTGKITLTKNEKIWLREALKAFDNNEPYDPSKIYNTFFNDFSKDFFPESLPNYYIEDNEITLFGIWLIEPESKYILNLNKVLRTLKDLFDKSTKIYFDSYELLDLIDLNLSELNKSLLLIRKGLNGFIANYTHNDDKVRFSINTSFHGIRKWKNFHSVETEMEAQVKREINNQQNTSYQKLIYKTSLATQDKSSIEIVRNSAFIIMQIDPDNSELEDIHNTIKAVCDSFEFKAVRADEIEHQDKITDVILERIKTSEIIIADLSSERPNVYYEIGYAHAIQRRPILIRKKGTKIHFDLSAHNVPEYKNNTELSTILTKRFEAIIGRTPK